jgi:serine/threonine-protein kinase
LGYLNLVDPGTVIVAIVAAIVGTPITLVGIKQYFNYRRAKLEKLASPAERKQIEALSRDKALLEERVQNLETIVCSVDLELNARLNKLAAHQTQLLALPAAGPAGSQATAVTMAVNATSGKIDVGTTLMDRFHVDKVLGQGGMGAVYLATDAQIGEQVALKVMSSNVAEDPESVQRFRREASASRKVTHPNVIRIHDLGDDGGLLFLSMEYFPGLTLAEMMVRRPVTPLNEVKRIVAQVCDALGAAHAAGVVHRDLKPQNILVNDRREVRVIDFGLATTLYRRGMTATGMIIGTPEYMAPEQVQGGAVDHRADIYALGAVAFHLVAGRPPFVADTPIAVGFKHVTEAPPSPRQFRTDLPQPVEAAILRCLAKDPAERFESTAEVKAAFGS